MSFYILDDLSYTRQQTKDDPNGKATYPWSDAYEINRVSGDCEYCPKCGRPTTLLSWERPRSIRLTNKHFPDRLCWWLSSSDLLCVSQKFKELYEQAELSGIESFEQIEYVKTPSRYSGVAPTYFVGKIPFTQEISLDVENSIISGFPREKTPCALCWPLQTTISTIQYLALHTDGWKGTDILRVYAVGLIFSQRFHDFIEENQLTNFPLIPVEDYRLE